MTRLHAIRLRRWVIQLTVASLLLTQSLGLLHRAVHQPAAGNTLTAGPAQHAPSAVARLFAGHTLDTDCRLFDQLAHADLAPLPVLALPCDFGTAPSLVTVPSGHQPAPEHSYCARAPPTLA
ncbi:MAG: hypothetical protein H7Y33_17610 [Cytophagales bacterium]|nr:hypothetical protein [Rhizobacter sp.]